MNFPHNYLTSVEVVRLWGKLNLKWTLRPDVNILSGLNGSGKSTIIRSLVEMFRNGRNGSVKNKPVEDVVIRFENGQEIHWGDPKTPVENIGIDIISTFDNRLLEFESVQRLSDGNVRTELDWEIFRIQQRYLSYQLAQGKKAIELLVKKAPGEELENLQTHKTRFYDIVDSLFSATSKKIDRENDELSFLSDYGTISPYMLSSGEKQILLILTTVLTQNNRPYVLLMDEPEISLHFDWQCRLIRNIREINPNVQLVMSTHSPAVVMEGWIGHVTEISELITEAAK